MNSYWFSVYVSGDGYFFDCTQIYFIFRLFEYSNQIIFIPKIEIPKRNVIMYSKKTRYWHPTVSTFVKMTAAIHLIMLFFHTSMIAYILLYSQVTEKWESDIFEYIPSMLSEFSTKSKMIAFRTTHDFVSSKVVQ